MLPLFTKKAEGLEMRFPKVKYTETIKLIKKQYPNKSIALDEVLNVMEISDRIWGSASYRRIRFKCSKCKKQYDTYGALRYYHFNCNKLPVCQWTPQPVKSVVLLFAPDLFKNTSIFAQSAGLNM